MGLNLSRFTRSLSDSRHHTTWYVLEMENQKNSHAKVLSFSPICSSLCSTQRNIAILPLVSQRYTLRSSLQMITSIHVRLSIEILVVLYRVSI